MNQDILELSFEDIKKLKFETSDECQEYLRKWALKNNFELRKSTGTKPYAVYLECSRAGKPRKGENSQGKRTKLSKKTGNPFHKIFTHKLGCPFRVSFLLDKTEQKLVWNETKSNPEHNHPADTTKSYKLREGEIKAFVKETIVKKKDKPSIIKEKLNLKFPDINIDYDASANILYKVKQDIFGDVNMDAQNLKELCEALSQKFPDFYFKILQKEDNKLSAIFIATPGMRLQYQKYKNLFLVDTTFGTNRFKLPLMLGTMVNGMGRTILAFFALVSSETIENFEWVFASFVDCFGSQPDNVMTDECPSFAEAIKRRFPASEHSICGFHKANTIKRHLSSEGCFRFKSSKLI